MKNRSMDRLADAAPARHSGAMPPVADVSNPGDTFIQAEIDSNRRFEWLLPVKALLALGVVFLLVVIRKLYFE
jgi:predicted hotdog family 3-hydroxylacyl-ACP dehydratase